MAILFMCMLFCIMETLCQSKQYTEYSTYCAATTCAYVCVRANRQTHAHTIIRILTCVELMFDDVYCLANHSLLKLITCNEYLPNRVNHDL